MRTTDRSQEILDAALAVFSEYGYHEARIEDIAERAGVGKGTVYLYFPGKRELFQALITRITGEHLKTIEAALSESGSLEERLVLAVRKHLLFFESNRDLAGLNVQEVIFSDAELKKKLMAFRIRLTFLVAEALRVSPECGSADEEFVGDAAIAFFGLLHAFQMEIICGHEKKVPPRSTGDLPEKLVSLFMRGLAGGGRKI